MVARPPRPDVVTVVVLLIKAARVAIADAKPVRPKGLRLIVEPTWRILATPLK